jgi:hypothetical protein
MSKELVDLRKKEFRTTKMLNYNLVESLNLIKN